MKNRRFQCAVGFLFAASPLVVISTPAFADRLQQQVQIETRFVEVNSNALRDLGLDKRLAGQFAKLPANAVNLPPQTGTNLGLGPTPSASTIGQQIFPSGDETGNIKPSGLLTSQQTQILFDAVLAEKGSKVISPPRLRLPSDQKATIDLGAALGFRDQGVKLDVTPTVGADGTTIRLNLVPEGQSQSQAATNVNLFAGQTMVVGGIRLRTPDPNRNLILFITPQTVDVLSHSSGGTGPDKIKIETIGTGETIGHVADLRIQNLTDEPLDMIIPPFILESNDAKNQDYVCPREKSVTIASRQTETVPVDGVCINRDKPPVAKGAAGELVVNTVDANVAQHSDCHIPAKAAGDLLRVCGSIYDAVDQLQKDGTLKDFPYKDNQQQKDILVQWSTWSDPQVCDVSKAPPATKDDLKKIVYKQIDKKGTPSSDTKDKIDKGIDTIFEKIELTTAKAKDLEKQEQPANQSPSPVPRT
jgi:hypothetical protein